MSNAHQSPEHLRQDLRRLLSLTSQLEKAAAREKSVLAQCTPTHLAFKKPLGIGKTIGIAALLDVIIIPTIFILLAIISRAVGLRIGGTIFTAWLLLNIPLTAIITVIINRRHHKRSAAANEAIHAHNSRASSEASRRVQPKLHAIHEEIRSVTRIIDAEGYSSWYPKKFLNTRDIRTILEILDDRRASTLQEAINTLVLDEHRQSLENAAAAQIAEQRRMAQSIEIGNMLTRSAIRNEGEAMRKSHERNAHYIRTGYYPPN